MKNGAQFFVQEASTASALMDVSYKIYDEENQKVCVWVIAYNASWDRRTGLGLVVVFGTRVAAYPTLLPADTYLCQPLCCSLLCA